MLQRGGASIQASGVPSSSRPSLVERGERHAGNHFFQAVLRLNFPNVTQHNGCDNKPADSARYYCCWTHGYANDACAGLFDPPLTALALVTRNPYSWLVAMHGEPYEHDSVVPTSFSEFLRAPFSYTPGSYANGPRDEQPNPVQLWADKVDSYRALTMTHVNLTHVDLFSEAALTRRLTPLMSTGGFFPPSHDRSILIEPLLEAAANDKMDGEFSREEFERGRDYEVSRGWLRCAVRAVPARSAISAPRIPYRAY